MDNRPIGVFDSGLGGLSTVRAIKKLLPNEDIIYFGDTGRVPYGTRSNETIESYTVQDIEFLRTFNCKMIVVACGTVSTVSEKIIDGLKEPATGIAKPAAKVAAVSTKNNKIAVMGTNATIKSGVFDREIHKINEDAQITSVACPMLVTLVENNWIDPDDEVVKTIVSRYLASIIRNNCDTIILGCTHFPILAPIIQSIVGKETLLVDTGLEEARYVKDILTEKDIQNDVNHKGIHKFFVSDKTANFCKVANVLLGEDISDKCEFVDIFKVI